MGETIKLDLQEAPAVIRESIRTVFVEKGYVVVRPGTTYPEGVTVACKLTEDEVSAFVREIANNAAQGLVAIAVGHDGVDGTDGDGEAR